MGGIGHLLLFPCPSCPYRPVPQVYTWGVWGGEGRTENKRGVSTQCEACTLWQDCGSAQPNNRAHQRARRARHAPSHSCLVEEQGRPPLTSSTQRPPASMATHEGQHTKGNTPLLHVLPASMATHKGQHTAPARAAHRACEEAQSHPQSMAPCRVADLKHSAPLQCWHLHRHVSAPLVPGAQPATVVAAPGEHSPGCDAQCVCSATHHLNNGSATTCDRWGERERIAASTGMMTPQKGIEHTNEHCNMCTRCNTPTNTATTCTPHAHGVQHVPISLV